MNGTDKQIEFANTIINGLAAINPAQPAIIDLSTLADGDAQAKAHHSNSIEKTRHADEVASMHAAKVLQIIASEGLDKAAEYADSLSDKQAEYMSKVMGCMNGNTLDAGRVIDQMKTLFYRHCGES